MNPIFAMLRNTTTGRYHPILFYESPLPGSPPDLVRHKSKGHHTAGFDTRTDALAFIEGQQKKMAEMEMPARTCVANDFEWDEAADPVPAMVVFFVEDVGGLLPAF